MRVLISESSLIQGWFVLFLSVPNALFFYFTVAMRWCRLQTSAWTCSTRLSMLIPTTFHSLEELEKQPKLRWQNQYLRCVVYEIRGKYIHLYSSDGSKPCSHAASAAYCCRADGQAGVFKVFSNICWLQHFNLAFHFSHWSL